MELVVDVEIEAPETAFQAIIDRLDNPAPMLQMLGRVLEDYEHELFTSSGRGQWQADDPATTRLKHSGRTLVDGGRLMRNLTHAEPIGEDAVHVTQGDAFYGRFLRDGDRGMPKRNPAPAPDQPRAETWASDLAKYLVDGIEV